jgi:hypothetical protein
VFCHPGPNVRIRFFHSSARFGGSLVICSLRSRA